MANTKTTRTRKNVLKIKKEAFFEPLKRVKNAVESFSLWHTIRYLRESQSGRAIVSIPIALFYNSDTKKAGLSTTRYMNSFQPSLRGWMKLVLPFSLEGYEPLEELSEEDTEKVKTEIQKIIDKGFNASLALRVGEPVMTNEIKAYIESVPEKEKNGVMEAIKSSQLQRVYSDDGKTLLTVVDQDSGKQVFGELVRTNKPAPAVVWLP